MSETLEEKRISELTERIEDFLCEGESFLIRCQDDELEVLPAQQANPVRRNHEELYGLLLSLNQQLADAALIPRWVVRLSVLTLILALHLNWFSGWDLPIDLGKLQSLWVYGLMALLGHAVNSLITEWRQHQIYAGRRGELLAHLNEIGLGKYRLLTQIEGEALLSEVSHLVKKDHAQEARF
jgi:hypothetical protein